MKKILKTCINLFKPLILFFFKIFFSKEYLEGRHFDKGYGGYLWGVRAIWLRNMLRIAPPLPWPAATSCHISNSKNIHFHADDLNIFQSPGVYFQNFKAEIFIGRGTWIGPNVGLITANHNIENLDEHAEGKNINIGERCWIGMNSVVLPGVTLGARTIVAAGSVVTKSFPSGQMIIGGVPAVLLKRISASSVHES